MSMGGGPSIPQRDFKKEFGQIFQNAWPQVRGGYTDFWQNQDLLNKSHYAALNNLQNVGQLINPLQALLGQVPGLFEGYQNQLGGYQNQLGGFQNQLAGIQAGLPGQFSNYQNLLSGLQAGLPGQFNQYQNQLSGQRDVLQNQFGNFQNQLAQQQGQLPGQFNQFQNQLSNLQQQIPGQFNQFQQQLANIQNMLPGQFNQYQNQLGTNREQMQQLLKNLPNVAGLTQPLGQLSQSQQQIYQGLLPTLLNQGALNPEQQRNVDQATRAAFAARGNALGNQSLGTELLNRDQYRQQRFGEALNQGLGLSGSIGGLQNQIGGLRAQDIGLRQGLISGQAGITGQQAGLTSGLANILSGLTGQRAGLASQQDQLLAQLTGQRAGLTSNLSQLMSGLTGQRAGMASGLSQLLNSITGQQAGLTGQQTQLQQGLTGQQAGLTGNLTQLLSGLLGQQAGLTGQQAGLTGQQAGLTGAQAGLLGGLGSQIQGLQGGAINQALGVQNAQTGNWATLFNPLLNYMSDLSSSNQNAAAAQNIAGGNKSGGIASGAGSIISAVLPIVLAAFSDKNLKENIRKTKDVTPDNIPIKTFSYRGDDRRFKGVIAQDVEKVRPDAVITLPVTGHKMVNVGAIGAPFHELTDFLPTRRKRKAA